METHLGQMGRTGFYVHEDHDVFMRVHAPNIITFLCDQNKCLVSFIESVQIVPCTCTHMFIRNIVIYIRKIRVSVEKKVKKKPLFQRVTDSFGKKYA